MLENFGLCFLAISASEGSEAEKAFIKDDSNRPPITPAVVELTTDDFWRHILARTDNTSSQFASLIFVTPVYKWLAICSPFDGFRLLNLARRVARHHTANVLT